VANKKRRFDFSLLQRWREEMALFLFFFFLLFFADEIERENSGLPLNPSSQVPNA